jgi:hypothetical protein
MLSAWMLLATSVAPSTFVHGHGGGDLSHQHDHGDCALSHSRAPTAHHDGHDDRGGDVSVSAADVHRHGYFVLLGAVTYAPMSSTPTGSHENAASGWETFVAVPAVQGICAPSRNSAIDPSGPAALVVVSIDCLRESEQRGIPRAGIAPASPLCDRARHERSGVQLA